MKNVLESDDDIEKTLPFREDEKDIASYCSYRIERAKNEGSRERNLAIDHFMRKERVTSESESPTENSDGDNDSATSIHALDSEFPEATSEDKKQSGILLYDCADAERQLNSNLPGSENSLSEWLIKLSDETKAVYSFIHATDESIERLEEISLGFPNFQYASEVLIGAARLSAMNESPLQFPNLLLDGPPGIGKTEWIRQCSNALNLPLAIIPLGSIHQTF